MRLLDWLRLIPFRFFDFFLKQKIMSSSSSEEAKRPYNSTFVRLGRATWFTLEHSNRARGNHDDLDKRLAQAKQMNDQLAELRLGWIGVDDGKFDRLRDWNDKQWIDFLRTWKISAAQTFLEGGGATKEESELVQAFSEYWEFYAALPGRASGPNIPEGYTMKMAQEKLEKQLAEFEERNGDALIQCNKCRKCALGQKLKRCTACQNAHYCSVDCQRKDWKKHKVYCKQK